MFFLKRKKRYRLISPYSPAEALAKLAANVMLRKTVTVPLLSQFADHKLGIYRVFEGDINGYTFDINVKRYFDRSYSMIYPTFHGVITAADEGSIIDIEASRNSFILLFTALVLCLIVTTLVNPTALILVTPILFLVLLFQYLLVFLFYTKHTKAVARMFKADLIKL